MSDTPGSPRLSVIPQGVVIPAGGFLLVWADSSPAQTVPGGALHVGFKLGADGESITLSAPDGQLVDQIFFGPQTSDVSEGRYADSGSEIAPMSMPTPGAANVILRNMGIHSGDGGIEFTFTTTPGREYRVEACIDFVDWQPLVTFTATGPTYTYSEPFPGPKMFYRAALLP